MVVVSGQADSLIQLISNAEVQTEQMGFRNHCNIQIERTRTESD